MYRQNEGTWYPLFDCHSVKLYVELISMNHTDTKLIHICVLQRWHVCRYWILGWFLNVDYQLTAPYSSRCASAGGHCRRFCEFGRLHLLSSVDMFTNQLLNDFLFFASCHHASSWRMELSFQMASNIFKVRLLILASIAISSNSGYKIASDILLERCSICFTMCVWKDVRMSMSFNVRRTTSRPYTSQWNIHWS